MKECDYCGRENEDDAVHCRECGTREFKNDPPKVRTRITVSEFVNDCATSIDELASSNEMLLSWMMAAWIAMFWLRLLLGGSAPIMYYAGIRHTVGPFLVAATFLVAPLVGAYSIVRWLRKRKDRTLLNLMAWMLLAFFIGILCLVWIVIWDHNPGELLYITTT